MGWIPGYNYRKRFEIIGSTDGPLFDYVLSLTINRTTGTDVGSTIYLGTNVQDDFEDIRFTTADGSTECEQQLYSYTIGFDAVYRIKFPRIRQHPYLTKFYIYYNNPSATLSSASLTLSTFATVEPEFSVWSAQETREPHFTRGSVDRPMFRIESRNKDYSAYLLEGKTERSINEISQASIKLFNNHGIFNADTVVEGDDLVVKLSRDGGETWFQSFTGSVIARTINQSAEGNTIDVTAVGTPAVRHFLCSPNQVQFGPCEVGEIFTGTPSDSRSKSWSPDANGNYPNGLLYKTGYSYSADSIQNIYTGSDSYTTSYTDDGVVKTVTTSYNRYDLPARRVFNGENLFNAIADLQNSMALNFTFDDNFMEFRCYRDPNISDFPTASVVLREGLDLVSFNYGVDASEWYDRVTVIGSSPSKYYSYGTGSHEYVVHDDNVKTRQACRDKAIAIWNIYNTGQTILDASCPPIDTNIIGYKITLSSERHSISDFGNVIAQTEEFSPGKWKSTLQIDNKITTIPKTLKEIKDDVRSSSKNQDTAAIYLNVVGHPDRTDYLNICAIGIGSSSLTNSLPHDLVTARPYSLSAIVPTSEVIKDGTSLVSYGQFFGGTDERIKEIVVFANSKTASGGAAYADYYPFSRTEILPTSSLPLLDSLSDFDSISYRRLCRLNDFTENHIISVDSIKVYEPGYRRYANFRPNANAAARLVSGSVVSSTYIPPDAYDHDSWGDPNDPSITEIPADKLLNASIPDTKSVAYFHADDDSSNFGLVLFYAFDHGFGTLSAYDHANIFQSTQYQSTLVYNHQYFGNCTVSIMLWDRPSDMWVTVSTDAHTTSGEYWSVEKTLSFSQSWYVRYDSTLYVAIKACGTREDGCTGLTINQKYLGITVPYNASTINRTVETIYERVPFKERDFTVTPFTGSAKLVHVYTKGSTSADGTVYPDFGSLDLFTDTIHRINNATLVNEWVNWLSFNNEADPAESTRVWVNEEVSYNTREIRELRDQGYAYFVYEIEKSDVNAMAGVFDRLKAEDIYIKRLDAKYSASDLYLKCSTRTPVYGTPLEIGYRCVGGEPVARFIVDTASRIDQGVCVPTNAHLYICADLDFDSTNAGPGKIKGLGVELGRPL